jgi:hypothetical protein
MAIVAKKTGTIFIPAPGGTWAAVCVDVVDLGTLEVNYGGKSKKQHKIRLVWQISELMSDTKPYIVQKRYTLSLHDKAQLRKDLESWRGKQFTADEEEGFDLEVLIGIPCLLNVIQVKKESDTFANVAGIMRLPKGMEAPRARDYIRVVDREPEDGGGGQLEDDSAFAGITDDDVPF